MILMKLKKFIGVKFTMNEKAKYLRWLYRRNLLSQRGAEDRKGIINKLNRKIRNYEER